jgi:small-conductance mechanosensitive channel
MQTLLWKFPTAILAAAADAPDWFRVNEKTGELVVLGIRLVGLSAENAKKLLFSIVLIFAAILLRYLVTGLIRLMLGSRKNNRLIFWSKQGIQLLTALIIVVGVVSIWFNDSTRMTTFLGLISAGFAFALQRVITAFAGYFVILRGKTFNVGDRIVMGGVRGDVIDLGFIQTRIMEMGEPPSVQAADPAMWVRSRQYTGRIVTITNDKVFDTPVYNYTKEFPYIWDELSIPITYKADRARAEQIILKVAERHTIKVSELGEPAVQEMERRYVMRKTELGPKVYWRLTDNWLELTVRFITLDHGVREVKNLMSRDILNAFDEAGIGIASATYEIVGLPSLDVHLRGQPEEHVNRLK